MIESRSKQKELGQYPTPDWAAQLLVNHYFAHLTPAHVVWEPTCGRGPFLRAIPKDIPAFGTEIDPTLADVARRTSGRIVQLGDFRTADLPMRPTTIIGNPPFELSVVMQLLDRAHALLPTDGQVGLILPCYHLQTPSSVLKMAKRWGIQQDMIPRNLFPGLSKPLCFAMLTKGRSGELVNFSLYFEADQISRLERRYRELLANGETANVWAAVTIAALEKLGGRASLHDIYREIEGHRPTDNEWWKAQVRKQLQEVAKRIGPSEWALSGEWSEPYQPSLLVA